MNAGHLLAVPFLRDHRQRRCGHQRDEAGDVVGRVRRPVPEEPEQSSRIVRRIEDRPGVHDRPDRVQCELELRDDAEVPAAAPQAPEELGVLRLGCVDDPAVGGDDLRGEEVVAREPVLAHQPADPAAEREAADARGRDEAARCREPVRLGLVVDVAPDRAAADVRAPLGGVDQDAAHPGQVDHDPVVAGREAGDAVAAAPHRNRQVVAAREPDGGGHVRCARRLDDERGPFVVEAVPHRACLVVSLVLGSDDRAADRLPQLLDGRLAEDG